MTDLEKVVAWDNNLVEQGIAEREEMFDWLQAEEIFFTPSGSVVPSDFIVYGSEDYEMYIMALLSKSPNGEVDVNSTLGLDALVGKIIFNTEDERDLFWSDIKKFFRNNGITFPEITV